MHRVLLATLCCFSCTSSDEYCASLNLTDVQCMVECEYYNNIDLYYSFIEQKHNNFSGLKNWFIEEIANSNDSTIYNETLFNQTLRWFTLSSTPYQYFGNIHPEVCEYSLGTYCNIKASASYMHGCCIPTHCKGNDAMKLIKANIPCFQTFESISTGSTTTICSILPRKWRTGAVICIMLCILLLILIIISTIVKHLNNNSSNIVFDIFCIQRNWCCFVKTRAINKNEWAFVDGLRVICAFHIMYYHIIAHLYSSNMENRPAIFRTLPWLYPKLESDTKYTNYLPNNLFYVSSNVLASMLTFFWMSGFFGIKSVIKILTKWKQKRSNIGSYIIQALLLYIKRYFRLMIMVSTMLLFELYFVDQIPNSFQITSRDQKYDACKDEWYTNVLMYTFIYLSYIWHNVDKNVNVWGRCIEGLWYIHADWYLFLFLPIIAYFWIDMNRLFGFIICLLPIFACIIGRLFVGFYYHFSEAPAHVLIVRNNGNRVAQSYILPWSWMAYYYMGTSFMLILMYISNSKKYNQLYKTFALNRNLYWFLLGISFLFMATYIVTPYDDYYRYPNKNWDGTQVALYYSFGGISYCFGLILFVFCLRFSPTNYSVAGGAERTE
eukprot:185035_1